MSRPGVRRPLDIGLLTAVGGAAAAGGLLAVAAVWVTKGLGVYGPLLGGLVVVLTAGCVAGAHRIGPGGSRSPGPPPPYPAPGRGTYDGHHRPVPVPPPPLPVFPQTSPVALTHRAPDTAPAWYERTVADQAPAPTSQPDPVRNGRTPAALEPVVDSSSARCEEHRVPGTSGTVRRVVQCPRCAYFDVTVQETDRGHLFRCARCDRRWESGPGLRWPATVVRPSRARHARTTSEKT